MLLPPTGTIPGPYPAQITLNFPIIHRQSPSTHLVPELLSPSCWKRCLACSHRLQATWFAQWPLKKNNKKKIKAHWNDKSIGGGCIPLSSNPRDLGENRSRAPHPVPRGCHPRANEVWSPLRCTAKDHWDFFPRSIFHPFQTWKEWPSVRTRHAKSALRRLFGEGKKI